MLSLCKPTTHGNLAGKAIMCGAKSEKGTVTIIFSKENRFSNAILGKL